MFLYVLNHFLSNAWKMSIFLWTLINGIKCLEIIKAHFNSSNVDNTQILLYCLESKFNCIDPFAYVITYQIISQRRLIEKQLQFSCGFNILRRHTCHKTYKIFFKVLGANFVSLFRTVAD